MIEALRINSMGFPSAKQVRPIALQAMRQVVGCEDVAVTWADPSVVFGGPPVTFNTVFFA